MLPIVFVKITKHDDKFFIRGFLQLESKIASKINYSLGFRDIRY
jgi:hypothetical protein